MSKTARPKKTVLVYEGEGIELKKPDPKRKPATHSFQPDDEVFVSVPTDATLSGFRKQRARVLYTRQRLGRIEVHVQRGSFQEWQAAGNVAPTPKRKRPSNALTLRGWGILQGHNLFVSSEVGAKSYQAMNGGDLVRVVATLTPVVARKGK